MENFQEPPHPLTQFNGQSRSHDNYQRLHAYYRFGKYLNGCSKFQLAALRRQSSVFAVKASLRIYHFFQQCGKHRLGHNPMITPTLLSCCSRQTFDTYVMNEIFAGAQLEGENDLSLFSTFTV